MAVFISCETYSFRDYLRDGRLSLEQVPKLLKELAIKGVVWNDIFFESWEEPHLDILKKSAFESVIVSAGLIMEGNLATDDDTAREKQIEEDIMKLQAAHYLGCPVVRINIGGTGDEEKDGTVGVERVKAAFTQIIPIARDLDVKLTIENHGGVSKKADWILKIINETDPKWLGSCLDFGNWPSESRYSEARKLAPYAFHVHAKTNRFSSDGEEADVDYGLMLAIMQSVHYDGAISIEYEGADDQIEGVTKTRDLIRKHWPGIE